MLDIGFRYHMPNFCAAIGLGQLERFEQFRDTKRSVLRDYQEGLRDHARVTMPEMPVERVCPFLALVLVEDRDGFMSHMREHEVGTGVHYQPLHTLTRFANGQPLPVSEDLGNRICSIPLLNDQTDAERERVLDALAAYH